MTKRNDKGLFVSHPTEGRAYTRSPDAIVPSSIRVDDILPMGRGRKLRNRPSKKDHSEEETVSE